MLAGGAAVFYLAPRWNQSVETAPVDHRAIWEAHDISKYRMVVVAVALPAPIIGMELTVENDQIIERIILACDRPSDEEWALASNCEAIRDYYSGFAAYTISELFDRADSAVEATQARLLVCNQMTENNFGILSSEDEMMRAGRACEGSLKGDYISVVNYDPEYGYPALIASVAPNALDGYGRITIEEFEVLD